MKDDGRSKPSAADVSAEIDEARGALVRFVLEEATRQGLARPGLLSADLERLIGDAVQARVGQELARVQALAEEQSRAGEDRVFSVLEQKVYPRIDAAAEEQRAELEALRAELAQLRGGGAVAPAPASAPAARRGRTETADADPSLAAAVNRIEHRLAALDSRFVGAGDRSSAPQGRERTLVETLTSRAALGAMLAVSLIALVVMLVLGGQKPHAAEAPDTQDTQETQASSSSRSPVDQGLDAFLKSDAAHSLPELNGCLMPPGSCTYATTVATQAIAVKQVIVNAAVKELATRTNCPAPPVLQPQAPTPKDIQAYHAAFTCVAHARHTQAPPADAAFGNRPALLDALGPWAFSGLANIPAKISSSGKAR